MHKLNNRKQQYLSHNKNSTDSYGHDGLFQYNTSVIMCCGECVNNFICVNGTAYVHVRLRAKIDWLIDWCLTAPHHMQKGQFVPTTGAGNQLSRLRLTKFTRYNECIIAYLTLHDNVTHFAVIHSSYTKATTSYLEATPRNLVHCRAA